jgi:SAM-dependent methyltransferase
MSAPVYVLGHSQRELERLQWQGEFFADITREALIAAGLQPGSRVLDIGCGAGDVSFLAADLIGPSGSVVGIDQSSEAVAAARVRAERNRLKNVTFQAGSIETLTVEGVFDALIGRFVLMHQADAAATLRTAAHQVRPRGLIVMIESVFGACVEGFHSTPHSPAYDAMLGLMLRVIRAAGADDRMGFRLAQVFGAAGLANPTLLMRARMDRGPHGAQLMARYLSESLRSVLPLAASLGVADCTSRRIDELEAELAGGSAADAVLVSPPIVAAWCVSGAP